MSEQSTAARVLLPRDEPVQLVDPSGTAHADPQYKPATKDRLLDGYRALVVGRRVNDQCNALVRQGRLAVYPSSHGQEACQVAAVMALAEQDWIFPTYRDSVTLISRGVPAADAMVLLRGDWHSGYDPTVFRVATQSTPLATQLLHAVGFAHAAKLKGDDTVVMAMCGDGATSEGDWHEGLNFSGIHRLPVIFVCENNQYAISVPQSKQMAVQDVASRAEGYGFPGVVVDGNDVLACYGAMKEAHERARTGEGPTLIECKTYRFMPHTSDDDDKSYRTREEVEEARTKDPVARFAGYLHEHDVLDDATDEELRASIKSEIDDAIQAAWDAPDPDRETALRHVFQEDGS